MRSTILFTALAGLAGMTLAACGDDSGGDDGPADAQGSDVGSNPDSPPGIDAHMFKGFDADEGGEVRLEYINFPAGTGARGTAYVYANPGTPRYHDFINQMGTCVDTRMKGEDSDIWPLAQNADTVYADVGPEIDILGTGMTPYRLPQTTSTNKDPFGRQHDLWYFEGAAGSDTDGGTFLAAATSYDVALPGSDTYTAQYFDNAIYMPEDFALTSPLFADPVAIFDSANTDQTYEWEANNAAPTGVDVLSLVAFTGANGPAIVCIEPNDGSITVPGAFLDIVATEYPGGGTIARQTLTHQVRELYDGDQPTDKRIDLIGVWCYAKGFSVVPAP
jgi:hypothetical protein